MYRSVSTDRGHPSFSIVTDRSRFARDATKARVHEDALRERCIRLVVIQQAVSDAGARDSVAGYRGLSARRGFLGARLLAGAPGRTDEAFDGKYQ